MAALAEPLTDLRKSPRQARSRATFEAIVEATAQVLVEQGYEGATTARVAERAGVSVGSLYQYFPGKEALIAALIKRHTADLLRCARSIIEGAEGQPLEVGLRLVIRAGLDAHRIDPGLHKILAEQVPRVGTIGEAMEVSGALAALLETLLRSHAHRLPKSCDPARAAYLLEAALEAITHKSVIERPDMLADGRMEDEMLALCLGYLRLS